MSERSERAGSEAAIAEAVDVALRLLGDASFRPLAEAAVQSFAPWVERWGPAESGRVLAERVRRLHAPAPDHAGRDVTRADLVPTQREEMRRG